MTENTTTLTSAPSEPGATDKFVAMVSAKADVTLPLSQFHPRSMLVQEPHEITKPRFPVIDYHNHLDALEPAEVLRVMDECDIERVVNITMKTGEPALRIVDKFLSADRDRFGVIAWMDWSGVERPDFAQVSCDRLERFVERGVCGLKFWKDLGLGIKDASGELMRVDDERLAPIFDKAAELGIPVMFHIADPAAFFLPIDANNERYEELAAHPDWSFYGAKWGKYELLDQRDNVIARHPKTTFVLAHVGECGENLPRVRKLLDRSPNVLLDFSARASELGRQPYSARKLFIDYADRILFGSDLLPEVEMYRLYYRFLETADEYFDYPTHSSRQGRWNICGLDLPEDVLRKIYRENALRLPK
ncbi:amidohydrolase family protein [Silvibacterium sp.]|uniref:amidohydrolase family protein n=1 Tax=Silvibacterium sp. TaxID=1964179 RepID=UPI0039E61EEE